MFWPGGVYGFFFLDSTGEFYDRDFDEKEKVLAATMEIVKGQVSVYSGTSAITTKAYIKLTNLAEKQGAAAMSILMPMFITPTEQKLYSHFRAIVEADRYSYSYRHLHE